MRRTRAAAAAVAVGALVAVALPAASSANPSTVGPSSAPATALTRPVAVRAAAVPTTPSVFFGVHEWGPDNEHALVGSTRVTSASWYIVEPSSGDFRFGLIDGQVRASRALGHNQLLIVLGQTPPWAGGPNRSKDRNSPSTANPPKSLAYWDRYITKLATHLKGENVAFQVLNEANLTTFFNGTPAQMADMTAHAYRIIKKILPAAPVVAASTTMRLKPDYDRFFPAYLRALAQRGWPVDAFSIHTYPPSTGTPATSRGYIVKAKADIARAGGRKPLWITETNFGIAGPGKAYPRRNFSGLTAASWLARAFLDARRLGVARVFWYSQLDFDVGLGIPMWAGTPAMRAERVLYQWLVSASWHGCSVSRTTVVCRVSRGAKVWTIQYSDGPRTAMRAPAGATRLCNILAQCQAVRPGGRIAVGATVTRLGPA
jgi:hypothetical protein